MIRLLIADDEEDVRMGMRECINWEENGISLLDVVADGREAYEMIKKYNPDIVLIDILMPKMTGLQVIEAVRNVDNLETSFVILTGCDQFEYARSAIQFQVDDYLLKPCSPDDILNAVYKAVGRIETVKKIATHKNQNDFFPFYKEYMDGHILSRMHEMKYPVKEEKELLEALLVGKWADVSVQFQSFWDTTIRDNHDMIIMINCCTLLYMELFRLLMERRLDSGFINVTTLSWSADNVRHSLQLSLKNAVQETFNRINKQKESASSVARAMEYIKKNYASDINLETVAQAVHVTPSYLSGLFKQNLGENFVDYVNRVRIENAKNLLSDSKDTIEQIAVFVGYQNEKYFFRVFKKITGLTPTQFRDQAHCV